MIIKAVSHSFVSNAESAFRHFLGFMQRTKATKSTHIVLKHIVGFIAGEKRKFREEVSKVHEKMPLLKHIGSFTLNATLRLAEAKNVLVLIFYSDG
jgi:hypothetical protein